MQYVWDETRPALSRRARRHRHGQRRPLPSARGRGGARSRTRLLQHSTTIYLHPNIAEYAEKLAAKMPGDLKVCYFVNSGSEANDLALLMARAYTGNYDVIALRNAYHGGNASGMGLTAHHTWKFNVPHSFGVHHAITPDPYRGPWGHDDPEAGQEIRRRREEPDRLRHARADRRLHRRIDPGRRRLRRFPRRLSEKAYEHVRAAGGVCIADEVQAGFGRTGTHYWGFETQGVIPDIVTMAKGIGNGCAARRGRHHAEDRGGARAADSLQHLRRQSGCLRAGQGGARSDRARKIAGNSLEDRATTSSPGCSG